MVGYGEQEHDIILEVISTHEKWLTLLQAYIVTGLQAYIVQKAEVRGESIVHVLQIETKETETDKS